MSQCNFLTGDHLLSEGGSVFYLNLFAISENFTRQKNSPQKKEGANRDK